MLAELQRHKERLAAIRELPPPDGIWESPCAHCPSMQAPDPEVLMIKNDFTPEQQAGTVFRCAWRPAKLCHGYCRFLGLTGEDILVENGGQRVPC